MFYNTDSHIGLYLGIPDRRIVIGHTASVQIYRLLIFFIFITSSGRRIHAPPCGVRIVFDLLRDPGSGKLLHCRDGFVCSFDGTLESFDQTIEAFTVV